MSEFVKPLKVMDGAVRDVRQRMERVALYHEDGTPFAIPELELELPSPGAWTTLHNSDLDNGWLVLDDALPPQYRLRPDGTVEFRGLLDPGPDGSSILQTPLATEYRHDWPGDLSFTCAAHDNQALNMFVTSGGNLVSSLRIHSDGTVNNSSIVWVSLAGIRYSAAD